MTEKFDSEEVAVLLAENAPLLLKWVSSSDLNPEAVERGRQVRAFVDALRTHFERTHIKVVCKRCKAPLNKPGALIFGPPGPDGTSEKSHLCVNCLPAMPVWMGGGSSDPTQEW